MCPHLSFWAAVIYLILFSSLKDLWCPVKCNHLFKQKDVFLLSLKVEDFYSAPEPQLKRNLAKSMIKLPLKYLLHMATGESD